MKKTLLSLAFALLTLTAGSVYWAVHTELHRGKRSQSQTYDTRPAAYPQDMWEQLSQIEGISLRQAEADEKPPQGLHWQNGLQEPELGDPRALKGGKVRFCNVGPFPAHLRRFGGGALVFFHYTLYTQVDVPLVALHPSTRRPIAGLAQTWAVEGRHVYFKLNPKARYSNGRPLRASDFLLHLALRSSPFAQDPFYIKQVQEQIEGILLYNEHEFRVTLRQEALLAPVRIAALLQPAEPSFYADFGPDFLERYAWRVPPTLGAYTPHQAESQRGRVMSMQRVPQWWAQALPHYRYRYNVDTIEHHFLNDEAQAWEYLLTHKLDALQTRNLTAWQEKLQGEAVRHGLIEKHLFTAHYPLPPYGIYLNCATLPQQELRQGLIHAMDMDKALALTSRAEGERLRCFSEGYGSLSPTDIGLPAYDPVRARELFHAAGYTQAGADGILKKSDGTRLSLGLCYVPSEKINALISHLSESARACGLEIRPLPQDWQSCARMVEGKSYELAFWADVADPLLPKLAPLFHSQFAHSHARNLHAVQDAQLDQAIEAMQAARNMEELRQATRAANLRIKELALWLPGWKENRAYVAHWRNLRFPRTPSCHFSTPTPYDVSEAHLFWLDPSYKLQGRYPEVDEIIPEHSF